MRVARLGLTILTVLSLHSAVAASHAAAREATGVPASEPRGPCAAAGMRPCVVELHGARAPSISRDCMVEPWSRYLRFLQAGKLVDSNNDGWWETAVEVVLDPARECGCASLRVSFENPLRGFSLDIGDSPTNDGYGGDAGTTRYAAETQVQDGLLSVFTAVSLNLGVQNLDKILESSLPPLGGRQANFEICDQLLELDVPGAFADHRPLHLKLQTPQLGVLYSFASGSEGTLKKDRGLYLGLNRVIDNAGRASALRIGTGVKRIEITLLP